MAKKDTEKKHQKHDRQVDIERQPLLYHIAALRRVLIVSLINAFQLFPQIMIMTDGGPNGATQVMVERIYKYGFRYYRMGYAAAFSWILFAIIMVCTAIQMKGQERWVNYDS